MEWVDIDGEMLGPEGALVGGTLGFQAGSVCVAVIAGFRQVATMWTGHLSICPSLSGSRVGEIVGQFSWDWRRGSGVGPMDVACPVTISPSFQDSAQNLGNLPPCHLCSQTTGLQ